MSFRFQEPKSWLHYLVTTDGMLLCADDLTSFFLCVVLKNVEFINTRDVNNSIFIISTLL